MEFIVQKQAFVEIDLKFVEATITDVIGLPAGLILEIKLLKILLLMEESLDQ